MPLEFTEPEIDRERKRTGELGRSRERERERERRIEQEGVEKKQRRR